MSRPTRVLALLACAACASLFATASDAQTDPDDLGPARAVDLPSIADVDSAHVKYSWANVLHVAPIYAEVRVPQTVAQCDSYERPGRQASAGAAVIGALIGGVIGNQLGSGDGRRAATAAGAIAGGAIGHQAGRGGDLPGAVESRCRLVEGHVLEQQVVAYDVEYRYRDDVFISRLDHHPGDRVKIRVAVSPVMDETAGPELSSSTY